MNRDHSEERVSLLGRKELITQATFHEAGHTAAIYPRSKNYNYPKTNFRVSLSGIRQLKHIDNRLMQFRRMGFHAQLEGGLLAENHVEQRDGEYINQHLVNYEALKSLRWQIISGKNRGIFYLLRITFIEICGWGLIS
jgi:hypothetical protein